VNDLRCPSCHAPRETDDNFCRRCGRQITVNLPVERASNLPTETSGGIPASLVGSVAVLAIGTGLEGLARRMAGSAARGAARAAGLALVRRDQAPVKTQAEVPAVVVKEFFYVREVELRR
jgi:hypothetical protein